MNNYLTPRCSNCIQHGCAKGCMCSCHGMKWKRGYKKEFDE